MEDCPEHAPEDLVERKLKRSTPTAVACEACRKRKGKCDGGRPTCATCRSKGLHTCVYETGFNGSRIQQLRQQNQHLKQELATLQTRLGEQEAEKDSPVRQKEEDEGRDEVSRLPDQKSTVDGPTSAPEIEINALSRETRETDEDEKGRVMNRSRGPNGENGLLAGNLTDSLSPEHSLARGDQLHDEGHSMNCIQPWEEEEHDSPISKVLSNFRKYARQAIAEGESEAKVLGSFEIDTGVVFSNRNFDAASSLSQTTGQVVSAWGMQSLAPKIGMMYMMFKLMRWQISLSPHDFNEIPDLMKPTPTQLFVPHPPFIDFLVWPSLRDTFISNPPIFNYNSRIERIEHIIQSINLARCFSFDEVLHGEPTTGQFRMQAPFRTYIEHVENWTLDSRLVEGIPELRGMVPLR